MGAAQSGESKEAASGEHFAQQLAAASGQQLGTQPNGMRAEQANPAQVPLQLSRDVAADQVAERVQMMMSKNLKNIDIRLDPPALGSMQIRMTVQNDQAAVSFVVSNQQTKDALEGSLPRLRELLEQQGVELANSNVEQDNQQQGERTDGDSDTRNMLGEDVENADEQSEQQMQKRSVNSPWNVSYYA